MAHNKVKEQPSQEGEIDEIVMVLFSDEEIRKMSPSHMQALDRALSNSNPTGEKWVRGVIPEAERVISKRSRTISTAVQLSNGVHRKIVKASQKSPKGTVGVVHSSNGVHRKIVKPSQASSKGNRARETVIKEMPKIAEKWSETTTKINTVFNKVKKSFQ